jgi:hypothetical protein
VSGFVSVPPRSSAWFVRARSLPSWLEIERSTRSDGWPRPKPSERSSIATANSLAAAECLWLYVQLAAEGRGEIPALPLQELELAKEVSDARPSGERVSTMAVPSAASAPRASLALTV